MCSCPLLLLAVEPSKVAPSPKASCVFAAQGLWAYMLQNLIQTELNSKFYSNFPCTRVDLWSLLLFGILWKRRCFLDVLI